MPTSWLLSATSYTNQAGLCAQESHFIFPYCYYTRGVSAFDTLSLFAQSLEGFLFSFLEKEICLSSPFSVLLLLLLFGAHCLHHLSWAPGQQPEVLSQ